MKNKPIISIILPTHNNEKTIFYSINSILCQSFYDFELIIVNDFSTDNTFKIIKSFKDNRIIYIENNTKLGIILSIKKAIKIAKGKYIARMDGDDICLPERLYKQLNYLKRNPNIDLVGSNIIFYTDKKVIGVSNLKLNKPNKLSFYYNTIGLPHPTWMGKANFFKNYKYDERALTIEDQDLLLRASQSCKFSLFKEPLLFYHVQDKINLKYKLKQICMLFISRLRYIFHNNFLYFFPIILLVFIISLITYLFSLNKIKYIKNLNSNYQKILNNFLNNT